MTTAATTPTASLAAVLREAHLLITCGPGGVGKTTSAAALGIAAAQAGRRVVVVTVDPARRLADALGIDIDAHNDAPHEVVGVGANGGSLWALMLDAEKTFDRLITDRAGDPVSAKKVLDNKVYRNIAGSLAGAQDYMAIERLHQLHFSGLWDLIVVDTPPSCDAIDLLEAPDRLVTFLGHPMYRAVTMPSRSFAKVTNAGTTAFVWMVRRLAGASLVEDIVEFFRSLAGMEQGLRQRAADVAALLRTERSAFVMVSSPRSEAVSESSHLASLLLESGFGLNGIVINMLHPLPPPLDPDINVGDGPLADQIAFHDDLAGLATSERDAMTALTTIAPGVAVTEIPLLDVDVHDLASLTHLAALLAPG